MATKKISCVVGTLSRGGCETHLKNVMPKLDRDRYDIHLFLLFDTGAQYEETLATGIRIHSPPRFFRKAPRWIPRVIWRFITITQSATRLVWHFLRFRPDIAHFFLPASYIIGLPIATLCGVETKIMSRRSLNAYQDKNPVLKSTERKLHKFTDIILGNSEAVVTQLNLEESVPLSKLGLIYNGVPNPRPAMSASALRELWQVEEANILLVIVANLIPYKGHSDLLKAFSFLHDVPPWTCLCIGLDSGIQASLEQEAKQLGIEKNIIFTGAQPNAADYCEAADICLLCSHEEGFSNAILEAMAAKKPLIVTDVGGNAEAVSNNVNGFVVPSKSPTALAAALETLIKDPNLRSTFGTASGALYKERFTLAACVAQYDALYKDGLSKD